MREWLKKARLDAGFTLQQLSDAVGVSWQSLSYYESGERRPSPDVAIKIGEVLKLDWTRFYDGRPVHTDEEAV